MAFVGVNLGDKPRSPFAHGNCRTSSAHQGSKSRRTCGVEFFRPMYGQRPRRSSKMAGEHRHDSGCHRKVHVETVDSRCLQAIHKAAGQQQVSYTRGARPKHDAKFPRGTHHSHGARNGLSQEDPNQRENAASRQVMRRGRLLYLGRREDWLIGRSVCKPVYLNAGGTYSAYFAADGGQGGFRISIYQIGNPAHLW